MNTERKRIQDRLRRKYRYSTCPIHGGGTFLYQGDYDKDKKVTENLINMVIGHDKKEKIQLTAAGHLSNKQGSIGSVTMTFEEIELLYDLTQMLRKEWAQND